MKIISKSTF